VKKQLKLAIKTDKKKAEAGSCIFCQIVKGEIPCFKIYEDKDFLVFLDAFPWVEGLTLVIPKKHVKWVWDLPTDKVGDYFALTAKVAKHFRKVLGIEFVMGWIYGYEVPHAHFHLMPDSRGKVAFYPKKKKGRLSQEKARELVKVLKLS